MDKLNWCKKQNKGIKKINPNMNISLNYIKRAKLDLENIKNQNKVWNVIVSYYACYNALYAVLIRYGIKSEIHSCSIELMNYFKEISTYKLFIEDLKENRQNTQYYLKEPNKVNQDKVKSFIDKCELIIDECNESKISSVISKIFSKEDNI
jgi:uncharacterized protein (UPF0332 family)